MLRSFFDRKQEDVFKEINLILDDIIPVSFMMNYFEIPITKTLSYEVFDLLQMEVEEESIPTYGYLDIENITDGHVLDNIASFSLGDNL